MLGCGIRQLQGRKVPAEKPVVRCECLLPPLLPLRMDIEPRCRKGRRVTSDGCLCFLCFGCPQIKRPAVSRGGAFEARTARAQTCCDETPTARPFVGRNLPTVAPMERATCNILVSPGSIWSRLKVAEGRDGRVGGRPGRAQAESPHCMWSQSRTKLQQKPTSLSACQGFCSLQTGKRQ